MVGRGGTSSEETFLPLSLDSHSCVLTTTAAGGADMLLLVLLVFTCENVRAVDMRSGSVCVFVFVCLCVCCAKCGGRAGKMGAG